MAWVHSELLAGDTPLAEDFVVRSALPPYSLLHYVLMSAQKLLSPLRSEQLVICLYLLVTAFGLHRFANAISPATTAPAILSFAFLFHTIVFQGFLNFCLGLGLFFWAAGWWIDAGVSSSRSRVVGFCAVVLLLGVTHPVALLLTVGFLALHLAWFFLTERSAAKSLASQVAEVLSRHRMQVALFLVSLIPCFYVLRFVGSGERPYAIWLNADLITYRLGLLWEMALLAPYSSPKPWAITSLAVAIVLLLLVIAVYQQRRLISTGSFMPAVLLGIGMIICYPFVPANLAGGETNIEWRFPATAVLILTAAASRARLPSRLIWPFRCLAIGLVLVSLAGIYRNTAPVAKLRPDVLTAPLVPPGARALLISKDPSSIYPLGFRYSPCIWAAGYYLQDVEAVVENFSWLRAPYIPLAYRHRKLYHELSESDLTEYIKADLDRPTPALPPEVDVLVSTQCRDGDATLPEGETLTKRYGLEEAWTTFGIAVYAKPGWVSRR